ncbi:MAG TPA: DUF1559 domain-containing protein, partial [Isosphaeraceae bacterium]|nr:DUF1559 domain-containing protein [Isosphaeraceae bacterium]
MLAVVAAVGLIVAFLLPALESARATSRRVQCLNSLRQLSLAAFNYQEREGVFPPGYLTNLTDDGSELGPSWGWSARMLPELEQSAVYSTIDFRLPISAPENSTACSSWMSTLQCPSSESGRNVPVVLRDRNGKVLMESVSASNYVGSAGTSAPGEQPDPDDGVFLRNRWIGPDHLKDGMSHTLMFGERSRSLSDAT